MELAHLVGSDSAAPTSGTDVREVGEWACRDPQWLELLEHLAPNVRDQSGAHLAGKLKFRTFVVTRENYIQSIRAIRAISADHKFLLPLKFQFEPGVGPLPRLISRVLALGDHALDSGRTQRFNDLSGTAEQIRR